MDLITDNVERDVGLSIADWVLSYDALIDASFGRSTPKISVWGSTGRFGCSKVVAKTFSALCTRR